MKTLKTLGKTSWEKLKIGEVFAVNGCWQIWLKFTENIEDAKCLTDNYSHKYTPIISWDYRLFYWEMSNAYKLPISVQRLFLPDETRKHLFKK